MGGGEARLPVWKQREHRCSGPQAGAGLSCLCLGHLNPQPPVPGFLQLWAGIVSQGDWFLAALVTAPLFEPYLHCGLRITKGPQDFPLSKKSSPPPARGRRQTSEPSCRRGPANKACFQGCLLVFIFPRTLQWEEQGAQESETRKGIISSGAPRAGRGWGCRALW